MGEPAPAPEIDRATDRGRSRATERGAIRCPRCNAGDPVPQQHTWWGGTLGARLRHRVRCTRCGLRFNGSTGERDRLGVALYISAVIALAGAAAVVVILTL